MFFKWIKINEKKSVYSNAVKLFGQQAISNEVSGSSLTFKLRGVLGPTNGRSSLRPPLYMTLQGRDNDFGHTSLLNMEGGTGCGVTRYLHDESESMTQGEHLTRT